MIYDLKIAETSNELTFHVELGAAFHPRANAVAAALACESDVVLDAIQLAARPGG